MGFFKKRGKPEPFDTTSFQAFYRSTLRPLSLHLESLGLRQTEELEDVLQNTYLEAHKNFSSIKDSQAALAWIMTIGRRQFYISLENKLKRKKLFAENTDAMGDRLLDHIDPRIPVHDEHMHRVSLCADILNLISAIDDEKRKVAVRMFFLEDYSLKQISEQMEINVSTLTTWMSRFRKKASPLLLQDHDEDRIAERLRDDLETALLFAKEACSS